MKSFFISLLLILWFSPLQGQEGAPLPLRNNEAKLLFTSLVNGSVLLGYERAFGKHIGVNILAGYKGNNGLLRLSGLDTDQFKTGDLTYSGTRIIPEFRYYLKERTSGMVNGFYFGAYLTFVNYKSDFKGTYINEDGSFDFAYDLKVNTNSIGLMIGYKLSLGKRFSLDFLIAGPGAGNYRFKLTEVVPAPDEFWLDLNEALELISILDLINADFDFSPAKNSNSLLLPSFRYGISLGYSF